jgi:hypothetical protein
MAGALDDDFRQLMSDFGADVFRDPDGAWLTVHR